MHLLFHTDGTVRSSASRIAPGVDVKGEGGYIIWWPAHGYEVLNFLPLRELPDWPGWLIVPERERKPVIARNERSRHSARIIADRYRILTLLNFMRASRQGERNNRLYWAACRLAEMKFLRPEQQQDAATQLLRAAMSTGLSAEEAQRTIQSGFNT